MSWNVNGIRAVAQKGFLDFVDKYKPDVLGLQETKAHPEQLGEDLIDIKGYKSFWSSAERKGYSGTVIYSRREPESVEYGIGLKKFDSEGRFVVTDYKDFLLYNVYFPNGGSGEERHDFKQEFLKKFTRHLSRKMEEGRQIVLMGDYNVAYLEYDVYDPKRLSKMSGFLPEERNWFQDFLKLGFVDCYRHFNPDKKDAYTWWSYRENARIGNRGWRIDHICITKGLLPRLKSCEQLDNVMGSDHCPVMIELNK